MVFCNKHFLAEIHQNASKHQKALGDRSQLLVPHTLQMFLRSSDTNFVEKIIKAFASADIPLYKLNKHIKNLFHDIDHCLPSENTCWKTVLQLSADELQRRNDVHDKQVVQITDVFTLSSIQYNISLYFFVRLSTSTTVVLKLS